MNTVTKQIIDWASKELDYWEKLTLDTIIAKTVLTEEDRKEILEWALEEKGLREKRPEARPKLAFLNQQQPETAAKKFRIEKIFNLRDVNALPSGQEIRFGEQLTLIYGENRAGKTGYVRPLSCATFARGERDVLPDVKNKVAPSLVPQADVEVSSNGVKNVVTWTKGKPRPSELGGYYVFDSNSMNVHLTRPNALHFSPAGLDLLTTLTEETDRIRALLKGLIESKEKTPNTLSALFEGTSPVRQEMELLGSSTNPDELRTLSALSPTETEEISSLETAIAFLKASGVAGRLTQLRQEIEDLQKLGRMIDRAVEATGPTAEEAVKKSVTQLQLNISESERSGINQFRSDFFTEIGTQPWHQFMSSAKALADAESATHNGYPKEQDPCLLCRQALSPESVALIRRVWEFFQSDLQNKLQGARSACDREEQSLRELDLNYFAPDSAARRLLEREVPSVIDMIDSQVSACDDRRKSLLESLKSGQLTSPPPAISFDKGDLTKLIARRLTEAAELEASDSEAKLAQADAKLRELRHRRQLSQCIQQAEEFVAEKKWAKRARNILGTTGKITAKHNDLFSKLVTDRYSHKFQELLDKFNCGLKTTIQTHGQKGEWMRQIVLSQPATTCRVEDVLSDGEKRIVAFADFLTEVAMDQSNVGIVLDDPVTSLDNPWKKQLARCLAEHAKARQVVIFTHDLGFLYFAKNAADELDVKIASHWIRTESNRPGFVYLDNSPMYENGFKSADYASQCYAKAKGLAPAEQEPLLQQGFGLLRTSYEALVIFYVFNGVVHPFEERFGYDKLRYVSVDSTLVNEIADRMDALSRHIAAHLHSDAVTVAKPTLEDLRKEIQLFEEIRSRQRALNAAAATAS